MDKKVKIISAGAGSGKTYRLTQEMVGSLNAGTRAAGIVATTFTAKAAAELKERVQTKLLQLGLVEQANDLSNALIGTVHALGVKLLQRFAFEAGVSPKVGIIADTDQQLFFNRSLSQILTAERTEKVDILAEKLGLTKRGTYDWRKDIRQIVDIARANAFDKTILEKSKIRSFETFRPFFGDEISDLDAATYNSRLAELLSETIDLLENSNDTTVTTKNSVNELKVIRTELAQRHFLYWWQWVKIVKVNVSTKSKDTLAPLQEFAARHIQFADFQNDIKHYIGEIFDLAIAAMVEFDRYKKQRGLIDYTDMETLVRDLLEHPSVQGVLAEELDLLMVDEFQDTSPIQLDIFLKLSRIAKASIWVGDPKQSIYGFRGAEPRLMQAIITHYGIEPENILRDSWRSRRDLVFASNAIFCKAFDDMPPEQVALNPKVEDAALQTEALIHWKFIPDIPTPEGKKPKQPASPWLEMCVADSIKKMLERGYFVKPKSGEARLAKAGDVAILCRTNDQCQTVAEALHRVGLKAAIARTGLIRTAEATLILAILRYILNRHDALAVAEILLFAERQDLKEILENRFAYLEKIGEEYDWRWAIDNPFVRHINDLRRDTSELSAAEILNLILEELDLRRIIAAWGDSVQRLENVEVLRGFAMTYEENCNRLQAAASLGGFLLWLGERAEQAEDKQYSGESSDAVNVLTYHKSKGLEYPIVVMSGLESSLRADLWGVGIEADDDTEGVDLDNILSGRWLRFWVNPYSDQVKKTAIHDAIEASEMKARAKAAALAEEARLMYVGITRARDYLIFPSASNPTTWLNRVWHKGKEDYPTLAEGIETPYEWAGVPLMQEYEENYYPKDLGSVEAAVQTTFFIEERRDKESYSAYYYDLKNELLATAKNITPYNYGNILDLDDDAPKIQIARALQIFVEADDPQLIFDDRRATAEAIIARFNLADFLDSHYMLKQSNAFWALLHQNWTHTAVVRQYPIRTELDERMLQTKLSFFLEAEEDTIILIQNDLNCGDMKKLKTEAARYSTEFHLIRKFLRLHNPRLNVRYCVHFPFFGEVSELAF